MSSDVSHRIGLPVRCVCRHCACAVSRDHPEQFFSQNWNR